jgi:hypothetical protein
MVALLPFSIPVPFNGCQTFLFSSIQETYDIQIAGGMSSAAGFTACFCNCETRLKDFFFKRGGVILHLKVNMSCYMHANGSQERLVITRKEREDEKR